MELLFSGLLVLTIIFCWYKTEKLKKDYKIQEEKYNLELEKIYSAEKQKIVERINEELQYLDKSIEEKQKFNESILKIREDELQRIIEKEKEEKLFALENELAILKQIKMMNIERDVSLYKIEMDDNINKMKQEVDKLQIVIDDYHAKCNAINQAIALENSKEEEKIKHQICLSLQDKEDIKYLLSIEEKINNKQLLRKLIWSEYLQKPFNEMLKRLFLGNPPKNVIYCIENIHNHKKYIGKTSAEVSKRWTNHIKTSLEIGTIKSQNIHKALYGHWDEFIFSVIVVSEKEKISEDEKYYIKLFESDIYGYNMNGGG